MLGRGDNMLSKTPMAVKAVGARVQAPASADAGTSFQVAWEGPGNDSDYISIARPDQHSASYVHMAYVSDGNPATLQAPANPGTYEVRYILGTGDKMLAKASVRIEAVTARLEVSASVDADTSFPVVWEGPGNDSDYISIARPDQHSGSYVHMAWVVDGNPATLKTPAEPGAYEVRYILGEGDRLLAKKTITVR
jgi:Ca-activated chloride channel family protein